MTVAALSPRVALTQNMVDIHRVLRDPSVYPYIIDDSVPKDPADFSVENLLGRADVDFYGVYDGDEIVGVWLILRQGGVAEAHTNFLPAYRGRFAKKAALICLDMLFSDPRVSIVTSFVPTNNEAAYTFAKWCGLRDVGMRMKPFVQDGVSYPVRELAIYRSEWCEV